MEKIVPLIGIAYLESLFWIMHPITWEHYPKEIRYLVSDFSLVYHGANPWLLRNFKILSNAWRVMTNVT